METLDIDNVFTKYQAEITEDIQVNELSLKEKTMLVPVIKHKWVARTMIHKGQLQKLEKRKEALVQVAVGDNPVAFTKKVAERIAQNDPAVASIQESIDKLILLIEYLEKVEKLTGSLTFDCKNIIDLQKLETT